MLLLCKLLDTQFRTPNKVAISDLDNKGQKRKRKIKKEREGKRLSLTEIFYLLREEIWELIPI